MFRGIGQSQIAFSYSDTECFKKSSFVFSFASLEIDTGQHCCDVSSERKAAKKVGPGRYSIRVEERPDIESKQSQPICPRRTVPAYKCSPNTKPFQ